MGDGRNHQKLNITISIPENILRQAQELALKRNQTLSDVVTEILVVLIEKEADYQSALARNLSRLDEARPLSGDYQWSRESLHERNDFPSIIPP